MSKKKKIKSKLKTLQWVHGVVYDELEILAKSVKIQSNKYYTEGNFGFDGAAVSTLNRETKRMKKLWDVLYFLSDEQALLIEKLEGLKVGNSK